MSRTLKDEEVLAKGGKWLFQEREWWGKGARARLCVCARVCERDRQTDRQSSLVCLSGWSAAGG